MSHQVNCKPKKNYTLRDEIIFCISKQEKWKAVVVVPRKIKHLLNEKYFKTQQENTLNLYEL